MLARAALGLFLGRGQYGLVAGRSSRFPPVSVLLFFLFLFILLLLLIICCCIFFYWVRVINRGNKVYRDSPPKAMDQMAKSGPKDIAIIIISTTRIFTQSSTSKKRESEISTLPFF